MKFEKRPETDPKKFKPCSAQAKKFYTARFSQFCTRNFKHDFKHDIKLCFTTKICGHGHAEKKSQKIRNISPESRQGSGEEKAHKHKQFCPVTARVGEGLPTRWPGVKRCVLCAEPKKHKHFHPGTRPGGSVTGVTEKLLCAKCVCAFSGP